MDEDAVRDESNAAIFEAADRFSRTAVVQGLCDDSLSRDLKLVLTTLGLKEFKSPVQEAAAVAIAQDKNVVVIMPTGSGKSLTYLLPASFKSAHGGRCAGLTVVLAPIVALVRDAARSAGSALLDKSSAVYFDADTPASQKTDILKRIGSCDPSLLFLFVTPTMAVRHKELRRELNSAKIARVVIDEFHCLVEWAHFYTDMNAVYDFVRRLPGSPPIALLSATATAALVKEVLNRLCLPDALILRAPSVRPNVHLEVVVLKSPKLSALAGAICKLIQNSCANPDHKVIVYTVTPRDCKSLATALASAGVAAIYYHGDISGVAKQAAIEIWRHGRVKVMVATVAFAMGFDDPRVTLVVNDGVPATLAEEIQKGGRAGRNRLDECSVVTFVQPERLARSFRVYGDNEKSLALFCQNIRTSIDASKCRQKALGLWPSNVTSTSCCATRCDVCLGLMDRHVEEIIIEDAASELFDIMRPLQTEPGPISFSKVVFSWHCRIALRESDMEHSAVSAVLLLLVSLGYIWYESATNSFRLAPVMHLELLEKIYSKHGVNGAFQLLLS